MKKTLLLLHILACCACVKATAAELVPPVTPPKPATPATITNDSYTFTGSGSSITLGEDFCGTTGSWAISYELDGATFNSITNNGSTNLFSLTVNTGSGQSASISCGYNTALGGFFLAKGFSMEFGVAIPYITNETPFLFQYNADDDTLTFYYYNEYSAPGKTQQNTHDLTDIVTLNLGGGSTLDKGITSGSFSITLAGGATSASNIFTWNGIVTADDIKKYRENEEDKEDELTSDIYWVDSEKTLGDIENDPKYDADKIRTLAMKGGTLVVNQEMLTNTIISSSVAGATGGEVEITDGTTLNKSSISATSNCEIELSGSGTYNLEEGLSLGTGISLAKEDSMANKEGWTGTVCTGDINSDPNSEIALHNLGNVNSSVQLGQDADVTIGILKAAMSSTSYVNTVKAPKSLTLAKEESKAHNLEVNGLLTLGTVDRAAKLTLGGTLTAQDGIKLGHIASSATAAKLGTDSLNVTVPDSELLKLPESGTTVLTLGEEFKGTTTLNGTEGAYSFGGKLLYDLSWKTQLSRATANQWYLVLNTSGINPTYVSDALSGIASSHNGITGMNMLNNVYAELNPQTNTPDGALAGLMDTVDAGAMGDKELAAAAGASVAVLGQALSGDVERQLRAIRNRAADSTVGSDTVVVTSLDAKGHAVSTSKTNKFCVWVNAEGNRAEQDADGTAAGYSLFSWGGTLGAGMQVNNKLGLGLALTAMRGDLQSNGPDTLEGDMDTSYLSAFARYQSGAWSHSIIGTVGSMDADYTRSVSHAAGSYTTDGDTEGTALGLMYELSREYTLTGKSSISPVFNVSYRHTEVDAYSESGSDAAVSVGDQSLDTVTLGLGARYAATVGQHTINRACAFEARALAKYDLGDRQTDTTVGFIGQATRGSIESAELGAFGVELGAGIAVPVGPGSAFADGSVELRSDYTNFNATVGYKIQF